VNIQFPEHIVGCVEFAFNVATNTPDIACAVFHCSHLRRFHSGGVVHGFPSSMIAITHRFFTPIAFATYSRVWPSFHNFQARWALYAGEFIRDVTAAG
jgi:hypothetical protein